MKPFFPPLTAALAAALIAALLPCAALADDHIRIQDGYARGANPKSGAAFMVIENAGTTACKLMGATTDAADKAELHTSRDEGGGMKMIATGPIEIGPGESHALARGGDHIMLMGVKQPLKDGESLALTLDMGDCGLVAVTVPVDNQRKPAAGQDAGDHAGHGAMTH